MKAFLRSPLITLSALVFMSQACGSYSPPPLNIYLSKGQVAKYKKVSLKVSSTELDVKYSRPADSPLTGLAAMIGVIPFLLSWGLDSASVSAQDQSRARTMKDEVSRPYFEKSTADSFLEVIRNADPFHIESRQDARIDQLAIDDFDGSIEMNIEDLALKRRPNTTLLNVYLVVTSKMTDVRDGKVIWIHREEDLSEEIHDLDTYKADGAKVLKAIIEKMFKKAALRTANDIIYSE